MKVDLDKKLKDPKGADFQDGATIAMAAYNALSAQLPSDQQTASQPNAVDVQLKRYQLIQKVAQGGVQDLTAEDIAEIKKRAAQALSIVAFGSLVELLEQRAEIVDIGEPKQGAAA